MSDRHYPNDVKPPSWARTCLHCKRPITVYAGKYGSNACRQAAYRIREKARYAAIAGRNVTTGTSRAAAANRLSKENPPPSAETVFERQRRRNPKKLHVKQRGGAI